MIFNKMIDDNLYTRCVYLVQEVWNTASASVRTMSVLLLQSCITETQTNPVGEGDFSHIMIEYHRMELMLKFIYLPFGSKQTEHRHH